MNEQEAIKILTLSETEQRLLPNLTEVYTVATAALEEVQQYRELGTVEECREAVEKQTPKKPIIYLKTNRADCPCCESTVRGIGKPFGNWCSHCGQKLNWRAEKEN